jgi:uroporphyrinogen decarboxylase
LRGELNVPLIGFSAAPFTLASYLIEGRPSRTWLKTKRFMYEHPGAWASLMDTLTNAIISYLTVQITAGVQAIQLFDSWVGCLSASAYRHFVLPYVKRIFSAFDGQTIPRLHFGTDTAGLLPDFSDVDAEVIGLDWRIDLPRAKEIIGTKAMQGNLDPAALLGSWDTLQGKIDEIFTSLPDRTGYIFNLGHGVLPQTDDKQLKKLVEYIHGL